MVRLRGGEKLSLCTLERRQLEMCIQGNTDCVSSVGFSPDGKHVVSGSGDKTVRVWSVESGEVVLETLGDTGD